MEPTISDAGPFEKLMTFEIANEDLEPVKARVARKLSRDLKIPGFRPGKAPRRVVEATIGEDRLRAEAIDEALPDMVGDALAAARLEPAATPAVESLNETDGGVEVSVRVALWPELAEPPDYVGREIPVPSVEIAEDELAEQIDRIRDQFAEIEPSDGPAAHGDFVSIDLSATHNGVVIESLSAEGLMVEVGGNEFIAGMSEASVGRSAPETAVFEGSLPAGFSLDDAAGEGDESAVAEPTDVEYSVVVRQVHTRKRPAIDDAWVDDNTEFDTLESFQDAMRARLAEAKLGASYNAFRTELITKLTDEIDIEIPDSIVNGEMEEVLHRFSHSLADQGIEMADYLRASGQTEASFVSDLRESALRNVRTDLLLDAVSEDAGLHVEDEEFDELLRVLAAQSDQTVETVKAGLTPTQEKKLRSDILRRKAHDALMKAAVPVDEAGTPIDFETLASQLTSSQDDTGEEAESDAETVKEEE